MREQRGQTSSQQPDSAAGGFNLVRHFFTQTFLEFFNFDSDVHRFSQYLEKETKQYQQAVWLLQILKTTIDEGHMDMWASVLISVEYMLSTRISKTIAGAEAML